MHGNSSNESLWPEPDGSNFADWLSGLLSRHPMAVAPLIEYARAIIPDFAALHAVPTGRDSKMWAFSFGAPGGPASSRFELKFEELSDGEKCTFVCAALVAANLSYGPVFTFWDEPDNYLALPEVAHFIRALRGAFAEQGQIVITTHNAEAIGTFAREDVFLMIRNGHLEPSLIRTISQEEANGDLVGAYRRGELG
jgi:predicted ATPase